MWKRLDEKGVVEAFISESKQREDLAVAGFLRSISEQAWASELHAVTSLGNLRFTRAKSYKDGDRYDSVHVGEDAEGNIISTYVPCTTRTADVDIVCKPDDAVGKLELMLLRLMGKESSKEA